MKRARLKIAVFLAALICLGFFLYSTDWGGVLAAIRKVGWKFLLLLCVTVLSNWLGVLAWRRCMPQARTAVSGWQLFWIRLFGETAALLNPTSVVGGDAFKIFLLREKGVAEQWTLHSILLSRAFMILSQCALILVMGIWLLAAHADEFYWLRDYWAWGLLLPTIALLFYWLRRRRILGMVARRLPFSAKIREAHAYVNGLWQELVTFSRQNKWSMFLAFLYSCLHWMAGSLEFYFILLFLGVKTTLLNALLVDMGVVAFKSAGVFVPGQIGIEEYGNKVMLGMIGIAGGTVWVTVSILRRARQLFWVLLAAAMYFFVFKKSIISSPETQTGRS